MNLLNRPAIKSEARSFISVDKRWLSIFWAFFIVSLFGFAAGLVTAPIGIPSENSEDYYSTAYLSLIIINILIILIMPLAVSLYGYRLNCLRNNEFNAKYIFSITKPNYFKFLFTEIVRGIFIYLWFLLLIIPGYIKAIAYSMTGYIICDNPDLSPVDAVSLSNKITKGYKWDIFVMYLSFIPWYLLGSITLGIGYIYVIPYMGITEAMFYENLKKNAIETGIATPAEFGA